MENDYPRLIYLLILGVAIAGWMVAEYRQNIGKSLRMVIAWGLIFVGFIAAYGLWEDVRRSAGGQQAVFLDGDVIEVPRRADGHYYLELELNGASVWFVIDTGATDLVLTKSDAEVAGFDPSELAFIGRAGTANGVVRTAFARVDTIVLGPHEFRNVEVSVNGGELETSLLGMSFLERFERMEISQDRLRLYP